MKVVNRRIGLSIRKWDLLLVLIMISLLLLDRVFRINMKLIIRVNGVMMVIRNGRVSMVMLMN